MRTRLTKIRRDLWSRKVRTLLVSSSIFIGVFGVVTLFSTGELLVNQLEKDIQQDRLAMTRIVLTVSRDTQVDNPAHLATLGALPGVTTVEGRAVYPVYWRLPGDEKFVEGRIAAYSAPLDDLKLEAPRLTKGEFPAAGQQQIAIERRMAEEYGLEIGDPLEVRILTGSEGENGAVNIETFTISGLLFQAYGELSGPGFAEPDKLVFTDYADAQHIAGFSGFNHLYARFVDYKTAEDSLSSFQESIATLTPYVPTFAVSEDPALSPLIENTRDTNQVLLMLAMVALIVSGFLVINVINSIVVEQRRQIGVMKSLGATRWDNFFIFAGIAIMYGLVGVIPGVLLGIPGGYFAAQGLAAQNNTVIDQFAVSPVGVVLGIVVGLAVPFLAAVIPVYNGTRVTILSAMSDFGIQSNYGRGLISRLIARLPLSITLRQALNNVNQKKFRLALTGTTLTIAVGAFMGIFAVFSSLGQVVDDIFGTFGSQVSVNPTEGQSFDDIRAALTSEELEAALQENNLRGIAAVEPGASLAIEIEGYNPPPVTAGPPGIFALGLNTENPDLMNFQLLSGTDWTNDPTLKGVVISSRIADIGDKQAGDDVVIRAGGGRETFKVLGVTNYPFDSLWMPWQDLARLGGLVLDAPTPEDYAMGSTFARVEGYTGSGPDGQTGVLGLTISADDPMSRLLSFTDGAFVEAGQGQAIISAGLAERGDYEVGDSLTISLGEHSGSFTVSGIFQLPTQLPEPHLDDVIGIYWEELAALEGRTVGGTVYSNSISVMLEGSDPSADEVQAVVDQMNEALLAKGITAEFTNWVEFNEVITTFINVFNVILNLAAALIAAVGAIGLLTSLSMSVFERQKEIGVMRSVGATSRAVTLQFLVEGLTIGFASWVIGIPLAYLISQGLIAALPFRDIEIGFPLITLPVGLVGMLIVVTAASLWPSLGAAR
ncbi:MAG: ABC transporter permease, partial [Chloroflexi bacterium]|nr:ABC transporter permease [Chloroflexota bacterium]